MLRGVAKGLRLTVGLVRLADGLQAAADEREHLPAAGGLAELLLDHRQLERNAGQPIVSGQVGHLDRAGSLSLMNF